LHLIARASFKPTGLREPRNLLDNL
jgi:hypothetical protein